MGGHHSTQAHNTSIGDTLPLPRLARLLFSLSYIFIYLSTLIPLYISFTVKPYLYKDIFFNHPASHHPRGRPVVCSHYHHHILPALIICSSILSHLVLSRHTSSISFSQNIFRFFLSLMTSFFSLYFIFVEYPTSQLFLPFLSPMGVFTNKRSSAKRTLPVRHLCVNIFPALVYVRWGSIKRVSFLLPRACWGYLFILRKPFI